MLLVYALNLPFESKYDLCGDIAWQRFILTYFIAENFKGFFRFWFYFFGGFVRKSRNDYKFRSKHRIFLRYS